LTLLPVIRRKDLKMSRIGGVKAFILRNEITGASELRRRDPEQFWSLTVHGARLAIELLLSQRRLRQEWRAAATHLSEGENWRARWQASPEQRNGTTP
jgi:hypothetical protein